MPDSFKKIILPEYIGLAISTLGRFGHEAFAVGGCVRDSLLGKTPADWDVCTDASPQAVKACFGGSRVLDTGIKHGTVTVLFSGAPVEITSYRIDGPYSDHRRPDGVEFTFSLRDDLKRRDFTINAMAYNEDIGLADFFGGVSDLEKKIIRCVGDPSARFEEDGLRILRALRFAAKLSFEIAPETNAAIREKAGLLSHIAAERIGKELELLLLGESAGAVILSHKEIIDRLLPGIRGVEKLPEICAALGKTPDDIFVRFGILLSGFSKEKAEKLLSSLRFSNKMMRLSSQIAGLATKKIPPDGGALRSLLGKAGKEQAVRILHAKKALGEDVSAQFSLIDQILDENQCCSLENLAVSGSDLIAAGIPKGRKIGETLAILLEKVIAGTLPNEKAVLLEKAVEIASEKEWLT